MTLNRRRFLTISGACLLARPAHARAHRWRGMALGAEAEITIHGPDEIAAPALAEVRDLLKTVESQFSLYDPDSALSRLNRDGFLRAPTAMFRDVLAAADLVHHATGGLFDPTVQPLWNALAERRETASAVDLIGWGRVRNRADRITVAEGQALTLNGIAQGAATDLVTDALKRAGVGKTLVNVGEYRALGGPWRVGVSDPDQGYLGARTLDNGAIATSSPRGTLVQGHEHVLHANAAPVWSTVSVEADDAMIADGFSTALTMAPLEMVRALRGRYGIRRITLIDRKGDLQTV